MELMLKKYLGMDWNNPEHVLNFEEELERVRKEMSNWNLAKKISWFSKLFFPSFIIVVLLYGSSGLIILRFNILKKLIPHIMKVGGLVYLLQNGMDDSPICGNIKSRRIFHPTQNQLTLWPFES